MPRKSVATGYSQRNAPPRSLSQTGPRRSKEECNDPIQNARTDGALYVLPLFAALIYIQNSAEHWPVQLFALQSLSDKMRYRAR